MSIKRLRLVLPLVPGLFAGSLYSRAADAPRWGAQVGLAFPLQSDLQVTSGSGLNPTVGAHLDWAVGKCAALRTRGDLGWFSSANRTGTDPAFQQSIHTHVRNAALGEEILFRPNVLGQAWVVGAGVYLIRWTVDSTNQLDTASGSFTPSGSSSWNREGLALLAGYEWNRHTETELRFISSHYGYQNLPARMATLNLVWTF